MEPVTIDKKNLISAYKNADKNFKKFLAELFGEKIFCEKITDRVKTFEDACEALEIANPFEVINETLHPDEIAYIKLKTIVSALNEGWKPNWKDGNEAKYYPYFDMSSGVGLSYHGCGCDYTFTDVGSRLVFKTAELAKYAGTQFADIYKDLFIL